ncbi:MAG TPA: DNA polymerase Y family protein [Chitinolyticbacter sp.]|nr:DNA polymerase Y family protein [Chitinolyticbacter sp.]
MLWLALHLHTLALDVFPAESLPEPARPRIVVASHGRGERLAQVDDLAASLGLRPDMKLSAALALVNELIIHRRRPDREAELLQERAAWALQFTPTVVIAPPATLLLEIGGCLAYFGGLAALCARVAQGLADQNWRSALAPTPLAAQWLACRGDAQPVERLDDLPQRLGVLPLAVLPLDAPARALTQQLGLYTVAELLALPRAGLNRRFGPALTRLFDQALGLVPDPREPYQAPDRYARTIDLDWPVETVTVFLKLAARLLDGLGAFLCGRGLGVQQLQFRFTHEDLAPTQLTLGMGRPSRTAADWLGVLKERITHYRLAAPATSVTLVADALYRLDGEARDLFGAPGTAGEIDLLLARLAARLGPEAVTGIATVPDHRPEQASITVAAGTASPPLSVGPRPGWLLPQPQALTLRDQQPWHHGPLQLLGPAERIESGWWDGDPAARDYYQAQSPAGARYWIFQNRADHSWWLHGVYA